MAQLIKAVIDTQKNSYRSIGQVNAADDLELELEVKMNGQPIEFINPECELLIKKSDNNKVRQTKDIIYQDGKFKIKVDEQGVTCTGIVVNQLTINDGGRISTCLFYFMVATSLDGEILKSISKVEVLEQLEEYIVTAFANLKDFEEKVLSSDETIRKLNYDMNESEKIRDTAELQRQETFKSLKENMNEAITNLESSINLSNMNEKERSEVFNSLKSNLESIKQDLINLNASVESEEEKRVQAEINRVNKALEIIEKLESTNNSVATAEAERVSGFNKIKTENNTLKEALTTINNTANSNEEVRKENETSRVEAEKARVNEFNTMKLENETFKQEINEQYEEIITKNTEFKEQMNTDFGNAKTDYFGEEHLNVVDRLNSDFDNVHQRINDASYLEYEGSNIKADNSYYGLTKDLSIKGRTLQNLLKTKPENTILNSSTHSGYMQPIFELSKKVYSFIFDVTTLDGAGAWYFIRGTGSNTPFVEYSRTHVTSIGKYILKVDLSEKDCYQILCGFSGEGSGSLENVILLEGDYTNTPLEELPYVEGIYSVGESEITEDGKYPVNVKSCGKNLFDTNLLIKDSISISNVSDNQFDFQGWATVSMYNEQVKKLLKPNTTYTLSCKAKMLQKVGTVTLYQHNVGMMFYHTDATPAYFADHFKSSNIIQAGDEQELCTTFTTPNNLDKYELRLYSNRYAEGNIVENDIVRFYDIQLEQGVKTPFEPYQKYETQILLDEPLMSLPNGVCDEILEDGTEIRRVGKVVLDGSEVYRYDTELNNRTGVYLNKSENSKLHNLKLQSHNRFVSDKFTSIIDNLNKYDVDFAISGSHLENYAMILVLPNSITNVTTDDTNSAKIEKCRQWFSQNPTTVYYELAEPVIIKHNKNINLKTFEGTTHMTSDNYLLPTLSCKVPSNVQAIVTSLKEENEELNNTISVMSLKNEETELENIETNLDQDVRLTMLELGVM